jgi:TonB family protein
MMNKTKSRFGAWKMLAALPVAALLMVVGCKPAVTENPDTSVEAYASIHDMPADTTDTYLMVEAEPEFPGGMEALMKYLSENIKYPEQAKKDKIQGKVYISFVVEKDGSVAGAKVLRGIGGGCDEEALRVVNAMPKWTPGKQRNTPVRVQFNLPVAFKLQ